MATVSVSYPLNFDQKFYWKKNRDIDNIKIDDLRKSNSLLQNIETEQKEEIFHHNKSVVCTKFSSQQKLVATSSLDGIIRLFSIHGQLQGELKLKNDYDRVISFSSDGQFLASSGAYDKIIRIWNVNTFSLEKELLGIKSKIQKLSYFKQQKDKILTISHDNSIHIWNTSNSSVTTVLSSNQNQITSFDISEDDQRCIIGCLDGKIIEFDLKTNQIIRQWKGHSKGCFSLKYCNDNKFLISGGQDKIIKIWNLHYKKLFTQFKNHNSSIYAINISQENIISSQFNQTIVWNWKTLQIMKKVPKTQLDYCFIEIMGNQFITGCPGNGIEVQSIL